MSMILFIGWKFVTIDNLQGLLWSWCNVALIISIEVDDGLLSDLLDIESFRIEALLLELILIDLIGIFGVAFPHPADHLHVVFLYEK